MQEIVNPTKAAELRAAFIKAFVDTSTECYQAIEKEKPTDIVYDHYIHRYLRDTLYWERCAAIPFRRAIQVISEKRRVYSMWDIRPRDILSSSGESWLTPPKPRYLKLYESDTIIEWDADELAALTERELGGYDSTNCLEISIPEDLYVFDDSFSWCVIFTHDAIDGERYCLLGRREADRLT